MKLENKAFLDEHRHYHTTLIQAMYMPGLNGNQREGMKRVMSEEFQPGYTTDLWCPPCVADMVRLLYGYYDRWLLANPEPVEEIEEPTEPPAEELPPVVELEEDPAVEETEPAGEEAAQPELPLPVENIPAAFPANDPPIKQVANPFKKGKR